MPCPVDMNEMVRVVVDMMRPSWEEPTHADNSRIHLTLDLEGDVLAAGIATEIREVLTNILQNSIQAMHNGGEIRISSGCYESYVWVKIADTGIGMTEEVLERIFDPFFTTKGVEGTGLGMSVAYGIIKRHSGRISVESQPDEGTTITVMLPAADRDSMPDISVSPHLPAMCKSVRILVVDDEEMFANVMMEMLAQFGHSVCVARNGVDALSRFSADEFDLVFTDLGMPGMSGWQVAERIKTISPDTPVVLLTGWGATVDEARLAECGIDMVLAKPINMEELSGVVSKVMFASGCGTKRQDRGSYH
jgi:CheY-like chemotaxis protein